MQVDLEFLKKYGSLVSQSDQELWLLEATAEVLRYSERHEILVASLNCPRYDAYRSV